MKIRPATSQRALMFCRRRREEGGFAVLAIMVLLVLMLVLVNGNVRDLSHVQRELKLIDQRQKQKFNLPAQPPVPGTNSLNSIQETPRR